MDMTVKSKSNGRYAEKRVDLVLEGGGVKGIGLVGALASLEEHGYLPQNIAGTSVGAVVGALLAAGYTAAELRKIMMDEFDFRSLQDTNLKGRLPLVGKPLNLVRNLGIYEGKAFERQMAEWLAAKGVHTFKDLRYEGQDAGERDIYRYKLQVITSDLSARKMLVLPRDAHLLGRKADRLSVARAVRMSMSIPVYFEPVRVTGPEGRKHVLVDGGLLSNFPVWLFDTKGIPAWPTFGLHLVNAFQIDGLTSHISPVLTACGLAANLDSFLVSLAMTMLEAQDGQYIDQDNFVRTIPIPTGGVGMTDFGISRAKKRELYQGGYQACETFLQSWNFPGYVDEFRSGKQHSRKAYLDKLMKKQGVRDRE